MSTTKTPAVPSTSIDFDSYLLGIGFKHVPKTSGFKSGIIAQEFFNKTLGVYADVYIDTVHGKHRVVFCKKDSDRIGKVWEGQYVSDFKTVMDTYLRDDAAPVPEIKEFVDYLNSVGFKSKYRTSLESGIFNHEYFSNDGPSMWVNVRLDTVRGRHKVVYGKNETGYKARTWEGRKFSDFKKEFEDYSGCAVATRAAGADPAAVKAIATRSIRKADDFLRHVVQEVQMLRTSTNDRRIVRLAELEHKPTKKMKSRLQVVLDNLFDAKHSNYDEAGFTAYDDGTLTGEFNFTVTENVDVFFEMNIDGANGGSIVLDVIIFYDGIGPEPTRRFECKGKDLEGMTLIADACAWLKNHDYLAKQ